MFSSLKYPIAIEIFFMRYVGLLGIGVLYFKIPPITIIVSM